VSYEKGDMSAKEMSEREDESLDAALAVSLSAPPVPVHLRSRLLASVRSAALEDQAESRQALAREAQLKLHELRSAYVAVRRRTLVLCVGVAFFAGVVMAAALPWLLQTFGSLGVYLVPTAAAAAAVAVGLSWLRHAG
jgi:hypothetical protein